VENPVDKVDNRRRTQGLPFRGPVLGVFAKQPLPGRVKTRLTPPLSPAEASALYGVALRESVTRFATVPAEVVLCWTGRRRWFARAFPGHALLHQGRGNLGARLARVTAALFAAGGGPVAVVGSDSPDLPVPLLDAAFAALAAADVAAIPCRDGGYALLALSRSAPELFSGIPWSSSGVLAATQRRAAALGLRFATIGAWDDLDDLPSLHRLLARSPECATARYAQVHLHSSLMSSGG
jgi:rSAM/selenodomain-associated transferase 1